MFSLAHIRHANGFVRLIVSTIILTFCSLILSPTVMAAKAELQKQSDDKTSFNSSKNDNKHLKKVLKKISKTLKKLSVLDDSGVVEGEFFPLQDDDLQKLNQYQIELETIYSKTMDDFDHIKGKINKHNQSETAASRHQSAQDNFQTKYTILIGKLDRLLTAAENEQQLQIKELLKFLEGNIKKSRHSPFVPDQLAFRAAKPDTRKPFTDTEQLNALVQEPQSLIRKKRSSQTEYLVETKEVQFTEAIVNLANELEHHPVKIHNWVRNNIEFIPTYGSIQGADFTLKNKQGNAYDINSLLIALLRASNIQARYVYGTIQLPIKRAMNWVGGVDSPYAASSILGQGGIPNTLITEKGIIRYIQLEHIWVEAYVDFFPSRAAVNKTPDSWIAMDASFKQYEYTQGMNLKDNLPFSRDDVVNSLTELANYNEQEGWATGINSENAGNIIKGYREQLSEYIQTQKSNATIGDVIGYKNIITKNYPTLPSSVPYRIITIGDSFETIPENLRHYIQFSFYHSNQDKQLNSPQLIRRLPLFDLVNKRVSFNYSPATAADAQILEDAAAESYNFPAYLVQMLPQLKIENDLIAQGNPISAGEEQVLSIKSISPFYQHSRDYHLVSGDVMALSFNGTGLTSNTIKERYEQYKIDAIDENSTAVEEMYYQIILGYWGEYDAFSNIVAGVQNIVNYRLPSFGAAIGPLSVEYRFGIPYQASYKSHILDVKENPITVVHKENSGEKRREFISQVGFIGSEFESSIYEQAFLIKPGFSFSAVTAIKAANDANIPIYKITPDNKNGILPLLSVGTQVYQDISIALNNGYEVIVPERAIEKVNFSGTGYIMTDPVTGSGSYRISGGREGNDSPAGESVLPIPQQIPSSGGMMFLIGAMARGAGVTLIAEGGMLSAISIPAGVGLGGLAGIIGILIVIMLLIAALVYLVDKLNPKLDYPEKVRHYTKLESFLKINKLVGGILKAKKYAHIEAIFFGDREQILKYSKLDPHNSGEFLDFELDQAEIKCPPSEKHQEGIFWAYGLPPSSMPIGAWIDLNFTRKNYPIRTTLPFNGERNKEIRVLQKYLLYPRGNWMYGIEFVGSCPY